MSATSVLKHVRSWPPVNRPLTSALRAFPWRAGAPDALLDHLPRRGEVTLRVQGCPPVRMIAGDDWITSRVWWRGIDGYEPETVRPFLRLARDARTVLDVGAFTGYFSLIAAAANPRARVIAFEPNPAVAARLDTNLSLNPHLAVTVVPNAVGAERGTARFHLGGDGLPTSSSLDPAWEGLHQSIDVAVVDLAGFVEEMGIEHVDLVKIDVEQHERATVEGMLPLLRTHRPTVILEVIDDVDGSCDAMSAAFHDASYRLFRLTGSGAIAEERLAPPAVYSDHAHSDVNHLACAAEAVPPWLG